MPVHKCHELVVIYVNKLMAMATIFTVVCVFSLTILSSPFSSSTPDTLSAGSFISPEKPNDRVLVSPNGLFSAGFHAIGINTYCFAVWFAEPLYSDVDRTVVWMANRDAPVNGRRSKLTLLRTGNLVLNDAGSILVWATRTFYPAEVKLQLRNSGNMVLLAPDGSVLWQSFDSPTDTLLPEQPLTKYMKLVSSRSRTNMSSGFYKLFFDTDNVLRLIFDNNELSSVYWPPTWLLPWEFGRSTYNNTKTAVLDSLGNFSSSDDLTFMSADYGSRIQRRLHLDHDGNFRLYSWKTQGKSWVVSWQAIANSCKINGICGENSLCRYGWLGRRCTCLPGHRMRNPEDWSFGCEPEFNMSCNKNDSRFIKLPNTEFYGYDFRYTDNYSFTECLNLCLKLCNCKGFQYLFYIPYGYFRCYPKTLLVNGYQRVGFFADVYLRLPKTTRDVSVGEFSLNCSDKAVESVARTYTKSHANEPVQFLLWFACGVGGLEILCVLLVWWLLNRNNKDSAEVRDYLLAVTGFKRFSFAELKKATRGFAEEIGRGSGSTVFKGVLADSRVTAVKRLTGAYQEEAEFLAEVNTIGTLNHMNLIEIWGYCVEGKHRLLVYEYMEHGSLKDNLSRKVLDWKKRFEIAMGTAKGLAYLHEECLEWVLHCDVKPQNILLCSDYGPKVADFGLSKLLKRGEPSDEAGFSRIRGTRGYMAPEWVTNRPITSKVDVYSYGVVLLEMVTGKSPMTFCDDSTEHTGLMTWVRETVNGSSERVEWLDKVVDPLLEGKYDKDKMGILVAVALQCVEEERDARPTMSQVVKMLSDYHNYH